MNIPDYPMEYEDTVHYTDGIEWLIQNYDEFPETVPPGMCLEISDPVWMDWRFVLSLPDYEVVFGNCIIPGVTREIFNAYKRKVWLCTDFPRLGKSG